MGLFASPNCECAEIWNASTNSPSSLAWYAVASSSDGTKLIAAAQLGGIYTTTNSGLNWILSKAPAVEWSCVASSADGANLAAGLLSGGIYCSTNGGVDWTPTTAPVSASCWSIASSTNGNILVAAGNSSSSGVVCLSKDSGNTWTLANVPNLNWDAVTCSADGKKLVAMAAGTNVFYKSADSGTTWVSGSISNDFWHSIASSADGTKLVVVSRSDEGGHGAIYTSTNSGAIWKSNNVPIQNWFSVASSSDGCKLVVAAPTKIYSSSDFGQTWISNNVPAGAGWISMASSSDGNKLVAAAPGWPIYTSQPTSPLLGFMLSGTNFILSWAEDVTGFQLQQNFDLNTSTWSDITNSICITNNQRQVIVMLTNNETFFRLASQE